MLPFVLSEAVYVPSQRPKVGPLNELKLLPENVAVVVTPLSVTVHVGTAQLALDAAVVKFVVIGMGESRQRRRPVLHHAEIEVVVEEKRMSLRGIEKETASRPSSRTKLKIFSDWGVNVPVRPVDALSIRLA